jgi:hypothetical protein
MLQDGAVSSVRHSGKVAVPVHSPLQRAEAPQSMLELAESTQLPVQVPLQLALHLPVHVPEHVPAQLPSALVALQVPLQVPSHVPEQVPVQVASHVPSQFAATVAVPSHVALAAQVPAHLTLSSPGVQRVSTVPGVHEPETSQLASQLS